MGTPDPARAAAEPLCETKPIGWGELSHPMGLIRGKALHQNPGVGLIVDSIGGSGVWFADAGVGCRRKRALQMQGGSQ